GRLSARADSRPQCVCGSVPLAALGPQRNSAWCAIASCPVADVATYRPKWTNLARGDVDSIENRPNAPSIPAIRE
ncbi:hypothetical protein, partial [Nocardia abscessus]|uniref:hypothetical protein n=1 Tax=Nocardia abscessus TaxID=120957 RepID=UPI0024552A4E